MARRQTGFGSIPGPDTALYVPPERPGSELQQIAEDIRAIKERYDQPPVLDAIVYTLAAGVAQRIERRGTIINAVLIHVQTGTLDVWFGEAVGLPAGSVPHMELAAGFPPSQIVLPINGYVITIRATAAGVSTGCVTLMTI